MNSTNAAWVGTQAAAIVLGLAPATLEKLRIVGGGPPYSKMGRSVRYFAEDLHAWARQQMRFSTSDMPQRQAATLVGGETVNAMPVQNKSTRSAYQARRSSAVPFAEGERQ
jgi:hypothetical protein